MNSTNRHDTAHQKEHGVNVTWRHQPHPANAGTKLN